MSSAALSKATVAVCAVLVAAASASPGLAQDGRPGFSTAGERTSLCRQTLELGGVEDDLDARIDAATRAAQQRLDSGGRRGAPSGRARRDAFDQALNEAKSEILVSLVDTCARNFSVRELRGIVAFYESAPGQAWLYKGRTAMLPAMEAAILQAEAHVSEDVERR